MTAQLNFKTKISHIFGALKFLVLHGNKLLFLEDKYVYILPRVQETEATTSSRQL